MVLTPLRRILSPFPVSLLVMLLSVPHLMPVYGLFLTSWDIPVSLLDITVLTMFLTFSHRFEQFLTDLWGLHGVYGREYHRF